MTCSYDTNGDGDCGRPRCPECGEKRPEVKGFLCMAPSPRGTLCDRRKGHQGLCTWDLEEIYATIITLRDYFKRMLPALDKM